MEIEVDSLNGNDNSGFIYKSLDFAYTKYRNLCNTSVKLIFKISNGYQYLDLREYQNCEFNSTHSDNYLKINKELILINVVFNINVKVELNKRLTGNLILNKGISYFNNMEVIDISKNWTILSSLLRYSIDDPTYGALTLIENDGELTIKGDVNIKVCRKFTFVKNNRVLSSTLPNLESQGGDLFNSSDDAILTEIAGSSPADIKRMIIKNSIIPGRLYNGKIYNDFKIANCLNNLIIDSIKLDLDYEQNTILFNIRGGCTSSPRDSRINEGDVMLIKDSKIKSANNCVLSNVDNITKVNTQLDGVKFTPKKVNIKKIKNDYNITDSDSETFHIDDTNNCVTVTVNDDLKLEGKQLYFRKINEMSRNKIIIKVNNCYKVSNGQITLDRSHPDVTIYEDDGMFYSK